MTQGWRKGDCVIGLGGMNAFDSERSRESDSTAARSANETTTRQIEWRLPDDQTTPPWLAADD